MKVIRNLMDLNFETNVVLTLGNFDGVHLGHTRIIDKVIELSKKHNLQTVVFSFSIHPMKHFGSNILSIQSEKDKIEYLQNKGIDYMVYIPFNDEIANMSPEVFISEILVNRIRSKFIVVGYDFHFGKGRAGNFELLTMLSDKLEYSAFRIGKVMIDLETASSTNIRNYLVEGDVRAASKLLGRNFTLTGTVVRGDGIGRLLGFPTANIYTVGVIIPACGVYATNVLVGDKEYKSITSIGVRPTVKKSEELRVEAHIFDFNDDIYDLDITIEFIEYIREEVKFDSFDALKAQIEKDCEEVKKIS